MNFAHLHLILNHFPIIGSLFGVGFLVYGLVCRNDTISNAGKVVFVIIALLTIPTYFTGEPAAGEVIGIPEVNMDDINAHEAAAQFALIGMLIVGVAALVTLLSRFRSNQKLTIGLLVGGLVVFGLMGRVANLGGLIRHSEIRSTQPAPTELENSTHQAD